MSEEKKVPHVKAFEGQTFVISVLVSVFSAVICMQIISRIGTTPNTSVIGALFAMALARIPFASLGRFRSLDRQNLVQTMASAAGFGAANCCLLAVGILYRADAYRIRYGDADRHASRLFAVRFRDVPRPGIVGAGNRHGRSSDRWRRRR